MDKKVIERKVKAAGISSFTYEGSSLSLFHDGAARVYQVNSESELDAAIAEFEEHGPPLKRPGK